MARTTEYAVTVEGAPPIPWKTIAIAAGAVVAVVAIVVASRSGKSSS